MDVEDASTVLHDASTEPAAPPADEPVPTSETVTTEPAVAETDASIPSSEPALSADEPLPTEVPTTTTNEPVRRHQQRRRHKRRRLQSQEGATTTVYDMTTPTAHGDPAAVLVVTDTGEGEPKTADTTETVVACPMELGESAGGSTLKVVAITDSHTLGETYQLMVNLPGITVRASRGNVCVFYMCVWGKGGCLLLELGRIWMPTSTHVRIHTHAHTYTHTGNRRLPRGAAYCRACAHRRAPARATRRWGRG